MSEIRLLDSWTTHEIMARNTIIKAQEEIIDTLEEELEEIKTKGREALINLNIRVQSFLADLSWIEAERDYYKDAYETVIKLFGINGGGGRVTLLRANWIIDFLISIEGREYGQWKANGRRYLTVDEVQRLLTYEIDDVLKLSSKLKHPRLAAAHVCKRVIKEAARRGIPIRKVPARHGPKYLILQYSPGEKAQAIEEHRPRGRPGRNAKVVKAVLESGRKFAGWAANYIGFHREREDPGG